MLRTVGLRGLVVVASVSGGIGVVSMPAQACLTAAASAAACVAALCAPGELSPAAITPPGGSLVAARSIEGGIIAHVQVDDIFFAPASIIIPSGATVRWTHTGFLPHTVTSIAPGLFDSGFMGTGSVFDHTFASLGTFDYECVFHPGMEGEVVVRLPGDATGDNAVTIADFAVLASNFNQPIGTYEGGDFNLNGSVEIGDFSILAANFNTTAASARGQVVPEPLGIALMGLAVAGLRRRATSRR